MLTVWDLVKHMLQTCQTVCSAYLMGNSTSLFLIPDSLSITSWKSRKPCLLFKKKKKAILPDTTLPYRHFERGTISIPFSFHFALSTHCQPFHPLLGRYLVIETALKRSSKPAAQPHKERKLRYQLQFCFWLFVLHNRFRVQGCWKKISSNALLLEPITLLFWGLYRALCTFKHFIIKDFISRVMQVFKGCVCGFQQADLNMLSLHSTQTWMNFMENKAH